MIGAASTPENAASATPKPSVPSHTFSPFCLEKKKKKVFSPDFDMSAVKETFTKRQLKNIAEKVPIRAIFHPFEPSLIQMTHTHMTQSTRLTRVTRATPAPAPFTHPCPCPRPRPLPRPPASSPRLFPPPLPHASAPAGGGGSEAAAVETRQRACGPI